MTKTSVLESGNGFLTVSELFLKMARHRPKHGVYFLRPVKGGNFSELCVRSYGFEAKPVCKVYTGDEDMFAAVQAMAAQAAVDLGHVFNVR